ALEKAAVDKAAAEKASAEKAAKAKEAEEAASKKAAAEQAAADKAASEQAAKAKEAEEVASKKAAAEKIEKLQQVMEIIRKNNIKISEEFVLEQEIDEIFIYTNNFMKEQRRDKPVFTNVSEALPHVL